MNSKERKLLELIDSGIRLYRKTDQDCLKYDILNVIDLRLGELKALFPQFTAKRDNGFDPLDKDL